jgi:hypothetical protein
MAFLERENKKNGCFQKSSRKRIPHLISKRKTAKAVFRFAKKIVNLIQREMKKN